MPCSSSCCNLSVTKINMQPTEATKRVLTNRKGKTVETPYTDSEAFTIVEDGVRKGTLGSFAAELVNKGARYGLSEEQYWWIHRLAVPPVTVKVNCNNIMHRFQRAFDNGVRASRMKVNFLTEGGPIRLSFATPRSKNFRDVYVTDDGEYPDNTYYGKIDHNSGMMTVNDSTPQFVIDFLNNLNDSPDKLPW